MTSKRLVLHVGLPKTGTSSLQMALNLNRQRLKDGKIIYPTSKSDQRYPNHPFLTQALWGNEGALETLRKVLDTREDSTVCLSHEGVTNQLNRMSHETTADFQAVTRDWEVVVYLVTRKPETWLASYWKQCVINPPVDERYANHSRSGGTTADSIRAAHDGPGGSRRKD